MSDLLSTLATIKTKVEFPNEYLYNRTVSTITPQSLMSSGNICPPPNYPVSRSPEPSMICDVCRRKYHPIESILDNLYNPVYQTVSPHR